MKKLTTAAVAAIAALSLSACAGGTLGPDDAEQAADRTPAAHESTTAPASADTDAKTGAESSDSELTYAKAGDGQEWADTIESAWLREMGRAYSDLCGTVETLEQYKNCMPTDPDAYITEFSSPEPGHVVVTVARGKWEGGTYDTAEIPGLKFVTGNIASKLQYTETPVEQVTAKLADGSDSTTWPGDVTHKAL